MRASWHGRPKLEGLREDKGRWWQWEVRLGEQPDHFKSLLGFGAMKQMKPCTEYVKLG